MFASAISKTPNVVTPEWLAIVRGKIESLGYGIVQIVVHDHHVTQIKKTEKIRLGSPKSETALRRIENV